MGNGSLVLWVLLGIVHIRVLNLFSEEQGRIVWVLMMKFIFKGGGNSKSGGFRK